MISGYALNELLEGSQMLDTYGLISDSEHGNSVLTIL
jgi:hypothetical protein